MHRSLPRIFLRSIFDYVLLVAKIHLATSQTIPGIFLATIVSMSATLFVLSLCFLPIFSAPTPYPVDAVTYLAQHNTERNKYALQPMKWNTTLVDQAQALADTCDPSTPVPPGTSISSAGGFLDATLQVLLYQMFLNLLADFH